MTAFAPPRAVTLLYHDVTPPGAFGTSGFPGALADTYKLTVADFTAHLDAIAAARADAPVLVDGARAAAPAGAHAPWLVSFDDGGASSLAPIAELLEARGWRGHFFITTGRVGTPGFVRADEVREIAARGHVVGSHTVTHPARMADLSEAELMREWRGSLAALAELLGRPVAVASVPGGIHAPHVSRAASAAGVRVLFNSEPTTRVRQEEGCTLLGRYAFKTHSPPRAAADIAAARPAARLTQWALWNGKKAVRRASPAVFRAIRSLGVRGT